MILDAAESEAPGLRDFARRLLEAEARHLDVPLDVASVLARRAEGVPEVHITGATGRPLEHLVDAEADPLGEGSALMALARAGAQAMVSRVEVERRPLGTQRRDYSCPSGPAGASPASAWSSASRSRNSRPCGVML